MSKKLYLYTFTAALGGLLFGFDTAVISGTIPYITEYFNLNDALLGWAVSSALVGCVIGSISVGKPGDLFGRRNMLRLMASLFFISAIGSGLANSLSIFVIFRFIGGLAVGGASVLSPMYISEIAPPQIRGRLVATSQLAIVTGILAAFFSNYLISGIGPDNWRWMFMAEGIPALVFFLLLFSVEKSPRWLVEAGQLDAARSVISNVNPGADIERLLSDIKKSINTETISSARVLFRKPYRRLIIIGVFVGLFNQLTGINVIMYYAPTIFRTAGFADDSALMQTVIIGLTNLVFTVIAMALIDRLGRKMLLKIGAVGMSICLALCAAANFYEAFSGYVLLLCIVGFIAFFASSQGVVIWVILAEMFPNNIRARASAIGSFSHWFFNMLTAFLFPMALAAFGLANIFVFYSICTLFSLFFFIRFLVETKEKSLEELESIVLKTGKE